MRFLYFPCDFSFYFFLARRKFDRVPKEARTREASERFFFQLVHKSFFIERSYEFETKISVKDCIIFLPESYLQCFHLIGDSCCISVVMEILNSCQLDW